MKKIYLAEVPAEQAVDRYIMGVTGSRDKWLMIRDSYHKKMVLKINEYDHDRLTADTQVCLQKFGFQGWTHNSPTSTSISKYGGLSFVYNSNHLDNLSPIANTLGTTRNTISEFYDYNISNTPKLKNSYLDTYSFTEPTELRNYGYIKEFLDARIKRTLIRSRLGVIKAGFPSPRFNEYAWHRDEQVCVNLRINIPIITEPQYMFQIENGEPYHLKVGYAYSWDTTIAHRVYHIANTNKDRIHFVLGFSPWFDFDKENQCWIQNDFWGKHPMQMIEDGDIFSGLTPVDELDV